MQTSDLLIINVSRKDLETWPKDVWEKVESTSFEGYQNKFSSVPPAIGRLTNLTKLILWKNEIKTVPEELGKLRNLKYLDLQTNLLEVLPSCIGRLRALERLELGQNNLTALPTAISRLTNLNALCLLENRFSTFPSELFTACVNLTELDISHNPLSVFPSSLSSLTNLQKLTISNLELTAFPVEVTMLPALKSLMIERNYISALPDEITRLSTLEKLDISYNDFVEVPSVISSLSFLKLLCIEGNKSDFDTKLVNAPKDCRVRVESAVPDSILPGLYLGSLDSARNRHFLVRNKVTHVLSIIETPCSYFPNLFKYKHITAKDNEQQDLAPLFEEAITWIHEGINKGGVVVHCAMGVRSASLVIAYVMKAKKLNYEDAFYFVKMKREVIYPNDSFRNQLMDLEQKLKSGKEKENCTIS